VISKDGNLCNELIEALRETRVDVPPDCVREIRKKVGLLHARFAPLMGVSFSGQRKWEQGVRRPGGAALTLLRVMDRNPQAVLDAREPTDP
jgi:putative transcriptional regulator